MVRFGKVVWVCALVALAGAAVSAAASPRAADPPKEPESPFMGEYLGTYTSPDGKATPAVAQVVARRSRRDGQVSYRAYVKAVASGLVEKTVIGKDAKAVVSVEMPGTAGEGKLLLAGGRWKGQIADDKLTAESAGASGGKLLLSRFVRKSPTELAPPPAGAIVLLPYAKGKCTSLDEWANKKWPLLSDGSAMVKGGDNRTKRQFSRFKLHLEFRVPPASRGSGNSGVYILDRYEIQVLDSFARKPSKGGCGAVYQTFAAEPNASLPVGRWQTYDITFLGPKMDGNQAVELPVVTVVHNGVTVHKDVKVPHATGSARSKGHAASGPIRLQDHGNPVRFRNVWLVELDK